MSGADFTLPLDLLRSRQNVKWQKYASDVLPAWVAEMDFSVAYPIRRAIERTVREQDYGYPQRGGQGGGEVLAASFARRMQARFGWTVDPALVVPLGDLVQGTFAALWAFSDADDGVLLQIPAYPPFKASIEGTGRKLVAHRLPRGEHGFLTDTAGLDALAKGGAKVLLLCNPQNPTGRVYTRAELLAIGRIAIERDLVIVSDEIHSDLVYDGARHIPIASLSAEIAARTVTITSPTKSFNIPGLHCGVAHFGDAALLARFRKRLPGRIIGGPAIMGIDATVAAWDESQPWLDEVLAQLAANRARVSEFLASELPEITWHQPEATYLGWLDCSALKLPGTAFDFFHDRAKVALNAGETFDPVCKDFVRLNFATSGAILEQILGRMRDAVRQKNAA
jgi:cystathionine beta-lyase